MTIATPDTPSMLPAALWWTRQGIAVFPLWWPVDGRCACPKGAACSSPAKHPMTDNGLHDATDDEATIRAWWSRWPNANIGVPTGHAFDVIDIDGAADAWAEFTRDHGTPEHMGIVMTGRGAGGFHLYAFPGGHKTIPSGKRGLPKGVEIKGVGGYVVAPPSMHATGAQYRWLANIDEAVIVGDVPFDDWYTTVTATAAADATTTHPGLVLENAVWTPQAPADRDRGAAYGDAVLRRAVDIITGAGEGGRWNALALEAAPMVARGIAGGCIDRTHGITTLEAASRAAGLDAFEVGRIPELIDRMFAQGITNPIAPPADNPADGVDAWIASLPKGDTPAAYIDAVNTIDDAGDRERTSWWPRDIAGVITGIDTEPEPAYLIRDDGRPLMYAGKVNGLIGESESGKTWVAMLAVTQTLATGGTVTYLDFEDTAAGIISRLRAMGATTDELARFAYIGPDETLHVGAMADLGEWLTNHTPDLVILDGFNAAMTLLGLDLNSNTDATAFAQRLLKPLARTGACVAYVDHVPKNREARGKGGIGAQAKRAMTTGCAINVDVADPFGRGMTGRLRLTIDKDRPGHVRAVSGGARYAGDAILESTTDGTVTVTIKAPDLRDPDKTPWRPTGLMERISNLLATMPDGASKKAIEDGIGGKAEHIRAAIDALVAEGHVRRWEGPRRAIMHALDHPYSETDDAVTHDPTEDPWA